MTGPRISVIIPVYNGEPYLAKTLDAVFAQDYPAHEVIVVDDGSKDDTPRTIARYGDRVRAIRTQNEGPAAARNRGIELATGDWLCFLDHDDLWFRNKLKTYADAIRRFPDVGVICSDCIVRYKHLGNRRVRHSSVLHVTKDLDLGSPMKAHPLSVLLRQMFIATPSGATVRRDVVDAVGPWDATYPSSQDTDYWYRCALVTRFLVLPDVLFYKRTHDKNLSGNKIYTSGWHLQVLLGLEAHYAARIRALGLWPDLKDSMARNRFRLGNMHFEKGETARAYAYYWEGWRTAFTPKNTLRFLGHFFRKTARLVTGGLLSRKALRPSKVLRK